MLKERIDYLCKKREIARKELVGGLVTQAHFANILAERYPLPEDLAVQIAGRLGVTPAYLLEASSVSEETLSRAEAVFDLLSRSAATIDEQQVGELPDKDDTLTVELTTALMKAVYYRQLNNTIAYDYLHRNYLDFFLDKYGRPEGSSMPHLPTPAKKALYYYHIQLFRSQSRYDEALNQSLLLAETIEPGTEIWLTAQNFMLESYIYLKQFDQAKRTFEHTLKHVYEQRWFHRLSELYIAYSGYNFSVGLVQEALLALAMAEANLVYASNQGELFPTLLNNRIIMLILLGEHDKAEQEIARYEAMALREPEEVRAQFRPLIHVYRCELAVSRKQWTLLESEIAMLDQTAHNTDQQMSLLFYRSRLSLAQGQYDSFMEQALACLPYYESIRQANRLEPLYEALAVVSEELRKYKDAAAYYKKLVQLLRSK